MDSQQETSKVNTHSERRRKHSEETKTTTSQYFGHSKTQADHPEKRSSKARQALLSFTGGTLATKVPPKEFQNPTPRNDPQRIDLRDVANETLRLLPGLLATRPDVENRSSLGQGKDLEIDPNYCPNLPRTKIRVINSDTIDAALDLSSTSHSNVPVCILNLANAETPGGGFRHGAMAQEEALCYRSSLYLTLKRKYYPIPDKAAIYSPSILIVRENASTHELLDFRDPSQLPVLSVVGAAAICQPELVRSRSTGRPTYKHGEDRALTAEKMRVILRSTIRRRHRQIILGAMGCGAFGNPNDEVAALWSRVLQEPEFSGGWWKDVVFAVFDTQPAPGSNYQVFFDQLDGLSV